MEQMDFTAVQGTQNIKRVTRGTGAGSAWPNFSGKCHKYALQLGGGLSNQLQRVTCAFY